ncbi:MAG: DUF6323 family protein [Eubacteriaceae bacterium]|nr:DUF6323 family protein [Eubacteriaceae bacterium]
MDYNKGFSLTSVNAALTDGKVIDSILQCNEDTAEYGLVLSEQQALALAQTRNTSLKSNKRVEFGKGVVDKLIMAICDSPYINQDNYEETLHDLIETFYNTKNNTWDRVSDDDLIAFIKKAFNGCCHGSMELLMEKSMELAGHIRCNRRFEDFKYEGK